VIVPQYHRTLTKEHILRYDSSVQSEDRILIFNTDFTLKYLAQSHNIAGDSTFQTFSGIFHQLSMKHGIKRPYVSVSILLM